MDRQAIKEMLREVLGPNVELVDHPKWVGLRCPLAPWTHEHGADTSPSAGVSVKDDGSTSIYNCYVCGKGTIPWFLQQMEKYTGDSYGKLRKNIENGEFLGGALPEWGVKKVEATPTKFLDKAQYLDLYESAEDHWYFEVRAYNRNETELDNDTIRTLQLQVDPADSTGDERILFPVFSRHGELYGFTGRAVYEQAKLKVRDYHGLPKAKVLLGLHLIREDDPYVVVVEGLFDYAMLVQYDYPVVAALHAGLTEDQTKLLIDLGKPVVLMYDNDSAGDRATEIAITALGKHIPLSSVKYPKREGKGGKVECLKDPASCTKEEVDRMVAKARLV